MYSDSIKRSFGKSSDYQSSKAKDLSLKQHGWRVSVVTAQHLQSYNKLEFQETKENLTPEENYETINSINLFNPGIQCNCTTSPCVDYCLIKTKRNVCQVLDEFIFRVDAWKCTLEVQELQKEWVTNS